MSYVQNTDRERDAMLATLGAGSLEELLAPIPQKLRDRCQPQWPAALTEMELHDHFVALASRNAAAAELPCFLGAGVYDHYVPAAVEHLANRAEFVNSYTQYQPEASQGYLQALFEYQSFICALTGFDIANASLYDGATALAEAILMVNTNRRRHRVVISAGIHPEYREVLVTYFHNIDIEIIEVALQADGSTSPDALAAAMDETTFAVAIQSPNFLGVIEETATLANRAHGCDAKVIAVCDPISLATLTPPGEWGADIAVMEGQCLGTPPYFGGPGLGIVATGKALLRRLPGRIVGRTKDLDGRTGYVLTLQTREQHIRRERATSNICTNQAYIALRAAVYLAALGPQGLQEVANLCAQGCASLAARVADVDGFSVYSGTQPVFKEFALRCPTDAAEVATAMRQHGIAAGVPLGRFDPALRNLLLVAVTERRTAEELDRYVSALRDVSGELRPPSKTSETARENLEQRA